MFKYKCLVGRFSKAIYGDGTGNGSTNQVSHLYSVSDTFDVRLIITSAYSCVDTAIKSVLVKPLPSPNFVFNLACYGESTLFTDDLSESLSEQEIKKEASRIDFYGYC